MIRVRRHSRQLASGKTADVRQHERAGEIRPQQEADDEWRESHDEPPPPGAENDPQDTVYFRKDDDYFAVHPDGTVHPLQEDASDETGAGDDAEVCHICGDTDTDFGYLADGTPVCGECRDDSDEGNQP